MDHGNERIGAVVISIECISLMNVRLRDSYISLLFKIIYPKIKSEWSTADDVDKRIDLDRVQRIIGMNGLVRWRFQLSAYH
jgi:hypothetical protein